MCIRDSKNFLNLLNSDWGIYKTVNNTSLLSYKGGAYPVSYTHLDVYKRQLLLNIMTMAEAQTFIRNGDIPILKIFSTIRFLNLNIPFLKRI